MSAEPGRGRGRGARGRGGRFQTSPAVRRSQTAGSNPTSTTEPGTQRGKKKGGGPNSPTQASDLAANPSEDSAHNDADTGEVEGGPGGMETTTAQGDGPPAGPVNPNATPFTPQSIHTRKCKRVSLRCQTGSSVLGACSEVRELGEKQDISLSSQQDAL